MTKKNKLSNESRIRVRGQRSIQSTILIHQTPPSTRNDDQKTPENGRQNNKRPPKISLTDFLNRKLQKTTTTTDSLKSLQGKDKPFLRTGFSVGVKQSINGASADQKSQGPELNSIFDVVFEQFKRTKESEDNISVNIEDESQRSNITQLTEESNSPDLSKTRNTTGGLYRKPLAPKGLVVLGGDPTPIRTKYQKPVVRNEKPLPLYNHYASGSGWWDSDMEGIDNDEVGFNEVWEGVGSATLGGLDWH
uniref:uncharacterized protein LOC122583870 isoform X1 n=1 Tax=Erigeron canadensis TaxID=72917 RepID=UPI001CB95A37|nr:uncharacterized protein LOC122583870 isoform X1 [Erigeron canadensis]